MYSSITHVNLNVKIFYIVSQFWQFCSSLSFHMHRFTFGAVGAA